MENANQEFFAFLGDAKDKLYTIGVFEEYPVIQRFSNLLTIYCNACTADGKPPIDPAKLDLDYNKEKEKIAAEKMHRFEDLKKEERAIIIELITETKKRFPASSGHDHFRVIGFMVSFLSGVKNDRFKLLKEVNKNFKKKVTEVKHVEEVSR